MSAIKRITVNPQVCGGRPCIRGMRIRVTDILDMLAGGASREEILADYHTSKTMTSLLHWSTRPDRPITR